MKGLRTAAKFIRSNAKDLGIDRVFEPRRVNSDDSVAGIENDVHIPPTTIDLAEPVRVHHSSVVACLGKHHQNPLGVLR